LSIVLLKFLLKLGGNGLRLDGVLSAVNKVASNSMSTPSVIPNALVVLSIIFKLFFNCLTNLFFRFIKAVNSGWVGQFACSRYFVNCSGLILDTWVNPKPAIMVNIEGIKVDLIVPI
jgi:hypothetical protein